MSHPDFELIEKQPVESLNLTVESYRHRATGARHLHLATADPHNAFLVAFLTVPQDSTGVAHILEHTVLAGSERFPVRDPFFMMLRRSLATFMNAFTCPDWTAYPFASQIRKDFDNLLQVYLDAAFFPRLDKLDFHQEGCRVELAKPEDPQAGLVFKGVVFNEMKGAMSSPARQLGKWIGHHLFPTITYHHNSGGDPAHIPDLTWEQLREFHRRHYHPSNAIFMTYGDITAAEHQTVFQERVLHRFQRLDVAFGVPDEQRFMAPMVHEEVYGVDNPEEEGKTHVVLSWLLGRNFDLEEMLRAQLLHGVLMDNSSSPLQHALETTELGNAPSPVCGLDDSTREMTFTAGLEGVDPSRAAEVERLILSVIEQVAREGVERERVESVFHQLELSRREITGDGFPYGLRLMVTALTPAIHGANPVSALAIDPVMERLRQEIEDPAFVRQLAQKWLLDNPHRLRLTMRPDPAHNARVIAAEQERLERLRQSLDSAAIDVIRDEAAALRRRQETPDDAEVLPKLIRTDIPATLPIPEGMTQEVAGLDSTWYDQPTNGLCYLQLVVKLPHLAPELLKLLPLFANFLGELGCGGRTYLETQALQAAVSGGIGARPAVRGQVADVRQFQAALTLSGKALVRNHAAFATLLRQTFTDPRFDELDRLKELVAQVRSSAELRVTDHGHQLAIATAESGMSPAAAIQEQWGGMTAIQSLKQLDDALADPAHLQQFANNLQRLLNLIQQAPRHLVVVAEKQHHGRMMDELANAWAGVADLPVLATPFTHPVTQEQVRVAWSATTQINFCAKAYPTVPYSHPDAPVFSVLVHFLRNGYLHRAIREQGGAYGGGAGYDSDAGAFHFYSYRDPRLADTLADFDRSLAWLQETRHEPQALEEAILGVIGAIDRPGSPAGDARQAFHAAYHGRTPALRRQYRARVLEVTIDDLRRVAATWLQPEHASIGLVSNTRNLAAGGDLGVTVRQL